MLATELEAAQLDSGGSEALLRLSSRRVKVECLSPYVCTSRMDSESSEGRCVLQKVRVLLKSPEGSLCNR